MPLFGRAIRPLIRYGLKRIDYVNPANKLVSKYAPPGWRNTLFKAVKLSEAAIGGKTAYDIYQMMAPDTPGNAIQKPIQKFVKTGKPYQTRGRYTKRPYCRNRPYRSNSRYSR